MLNTKLKLEKKRKHENDIYKVRKTSEKYVSNKKEMKYDGLKSQYQAKRNEMKLDTSGQIKCCWE